MKKSKKPAKKSAKKAASPNTIGFIPLADWVLIKPEPIETKTASGIIIPDTAKQEKASIGRVVAAGPGKRGDDNELVPVAVKSGQKVYFNQGWESELEWKGEKYFLVHEGDVKAILE